MSPCYERFATGIKRTNVISLRWNLHIKDTCASMLLSVAEECPLYEGVIFFILNFGRKSKFVRLSQVSVVETCLLMVAPLFYVSA